ncbi:MAG TPA: hypothetical protein VLJ42_05760 [Solirubrobacteraceae bacterium]|nr:hypothetical protein [Solirubrobacteraceae bacterium]
MSVLAPLDLERRRTLGELLRTSLRLYTTNLRTVLTVTGAIVVTVDLIMGLGLNQLTSGYQAKPAQSVTYVELLVQLLVLTPLVNATAARLVLELSNGRRPSPSEALQHGLDVFAPVLVVVIIWVAAIAAGSLLIFVGIYFLVIWYFGTQAVAVEGLSGFAALRRSAELVSGNWLRTAAALLAITLVGNLIPGLVVAFAADALAHAADAQVIVLLGSMLTQLFSLSFIGLAIALLFFDLRAKHAGAVLASPSHRDADRPEIDPEADRLPIDPGRGEDSRTDPDRQ